MMLPSGCLALVTNRSSNASTLAGLLITWVKKLSSMHSRSLLDCLQLIVLLSQQISGRFKSPSRTKSLWAQCLLVAEAERLHQQATLQPACSRPQPWSSLCCLGHWFLPTGFCLIFTYMAILQRQHFTLNPPLGIESHPSPSPYSPFPSSQPLDVNSCTPVMRLPWVSHQVSITAQSCSFLAAPVPSRSSCLLALLCAVA